MGEPSLQAAGWYPDPWQPGQQRYWSGTEWTPHVAPASAPPGSMPRDELVRLPWWQTWWAIVPGLLLCLPIGLVGLWMRDATSTRVKWLVTAAAVGLFALALSALDSEPVRAPAADDASAGSSPTASDSAASSEPQIREVRIPSIEDRPIDKARVTLRRLGVTLEVVARRPSRLPAGTVLRQDIKRGTMVVPGTIVEVVVAAPLPKVVSVVGVSADTAAARLRRAGFRVERTFSTVTSGTGGLVLSQTPASGARARPGAVVTIVVAKLVPTLTGGGGGGHCTSGYSPCLTPASDYDCAGGGGDGPEYVYGTVRVTGPDIYDLDRDGDGVGCD